MAGRGQRQVWRLAGALVTAALAVPFALAQLPAPLPPEIRHGRELLTNRQYREAETVFRAFLQQHSQSVQAELGLGEAQMGLHAYQAAELTLRQVVSQQPELWQAHKNLVVIEAALGRWDEFDRERMLLALARRRGAPGISSRESDVIDSFEVAGGHWVVRAYFVPVGRSAARYNFERFSEDGKAQTYISLEDAAAARAALTPGDIRVGSAPGAVTDGTASADLALNWYTGRAHGTIRTYTGEPSYERLRSDVMHWIRKNPTVR